MPLFLASVVDGLIVGQSYQTGWIRVTSLVVGLIVGQSYQTGWIRVTN